MNRIARIFSVFYIEAKSYLMNPVAIFWTFLYPFLILGFLIFAFDSGDAESQHLDGFRFNAVTGILAITVVSTALFGFGQALSEMRARKALLPYQVVPVSIFGVCLALILSRTVILVTFGVFFVYVTAGLLGIPFEYTAATLTHMVAGIAIASYFSLSVSLLVLLFIRRTTTFISFSNIINLYVILTADAFIPLNAFPDWSRWIVLSSPFYYLTDMIRTYMTQTVATDAALIGVALIVISTVVVWAAARRSLFSPYID